jgi:hypothetical protein
LNLAEGFNSSELSRLDQVEHHQSLWCYIHYVVNSKITHLLRTIAPTNVKEFINDFMQEQVRLTQRVFNIPSITMESQEADSTTADDHQLWIAFHNSRCQSQMKLPIDSGGMGLRYYDDIAQTAFLASVISCRQHLDQFPDWTRTATYCEAASAYDYWAAHGNLLKARFPIHQCYLSQKSCVIL